MPKHRHLLAVNGHHCGLEPVFGPSGVDDEVDAAVEFVDHVGRRCWADLPEAIGAGGRNRHTGCGDDCGCDGM